MNVIIKILLFFLVIFVFLILMDFISYFFKSYSTIFLIIWLIIPIVATIIRYNKNSILISKKKIEIIRNVLMTLSVIFSFFIFGYYLISCGNNYTDYIEWSDIDTSHWFNKLFLWINEIYEYVSVKFILEWILIIPCFLNPIITWKQCSVIYNKISI